MQIVLDEKLQKILSMVAQAYTYKEIAPEVGYSVIQVKRKVKHLCGLYNVKNKIELALEYQAELLANN